MPVDFEEGLELIYATGIEKVVLGEGFLAGIEVCMQIDMTNRVIHPPGDTIELPRTHRAQSVITQRTAAPNTRLLPLVDIFNLKGFQCRYSIVDAATSLWQRENTIVRRDDVASVARLQARLRSGNLIMYPSQKEIKEYLTCLRRDGLDRHIDWHGLATEFRSFQDMLPEELSASLNYVASRYVSVLDKLKRNFTGRELAEQESKLENIWVIGTTDMVDGYTHFLQSNLGISDLDAHAVRISLDALIEQRIRVYHALVEKTNVAVAQTGPDSLWLRNHDAYIATRLRESVVSDRTSFIPARGTYSTRDLTVVGQIAQAYQFEIDGAYAGERNEALLALNLAFADMKEETLIQRNIVSENMAVLLRNSRCQGHSLALEAVGRYLCQKKSSPSNETESLFTAVDYFVFHDIYEAILSTYHQNDGNGAEAIRAGVAHGETATAQAYAKNPAVARWGTSMEQYWENFYTVPDHEELTQSDRQIEQLLAKIGRSPRNSNSTHQNYINDWQNFLLSIDKEPKP